MREGTLLAAAVVAVSVAACGGTTTADVCAGATCSDHGFCVSRWDVAYCVCASGYHPAALDCVVNDPANPCAGIDCSGHGTCRDAGAVPICDCAPGYVHMTGDTCDAGGCALVCVPITPPDGGPPDDAGVDLADDASDEPDVDAAEEAGPVCGDGVVEGDELCDDGNFDDADGCTMACGYSCYTPAECDLPPVCNTRNCVPNENGQACVTRPVAEGETCDDGHACTDPDRCDMSGLCDGDPIGSSALPDHQPGTTGDVPGIGTVNGLCVIAVYYCSESGPVDQEAPGAGYVNTGGADGCGYNGCGYDGDPNHCQENFCKDCAGDCAANC